MSLLTDYIRLAIADRIIAKRIFVSEVTQIGRGEKRTRSFLFKAWERRKKQAKKKAVESAKKLKKPEIISNEINQIMDKWGEDVIPIFSVEFETAYRLGRDVGYKKASRQIKGSLQYGLPKEEKIKKTKNAELLPSFDLVDKGNIKALTKHQTFWIGDFYERGISDSIAETTKEVMAEAGNSSLKAGKLMSKKLDESFKHVKLPKGFVGTPKQYFSGLTANAFTVARVHGQMRSFAEIGITSYTISNPGGKRTCERCAHLDGKRFTTRQGVDQMHSELSANTKKGVKAVHPWLSLKELRKISPKPGHVGSKDTKALSEHGQALPPYHFKCRCTVDVSSESMSYNSLTPMTPPTPTRPSRAVEMRPPKSVSTENDSIVKMISTATVKKSETLTVAGTKTKYLTMKTHDNKSVTALFRQSKNPNYNGAELSYYKMDREIGGKTVVQATVVRDPGLKNGPGVLQYHEKGWDTAEAITNQQSKRICLLDFISANSSRYRLTILKTTKKKLSVVNNGNSFSEKIPKKYLFPTKDKISSINSKDISNLKKISLNRLAEIFEQSGLKRNAARLAMLRIQTIINEPNILTKETVEKLWKDIKDSPETYMGSGEIKKIDSALDKVYPRK